MPSLWSRIGVNRRKYQTEDTSKSEKTSSKDKGRQSRMKRLFSFGSKDKKVPQHVHRQTSLNADPVFPHMAPKSKGIERGIEDEKEAERKLLDNIVNTSQASNRRRLAYEIFPDSNKPTTPKARKNEATHFVSEPCLVGDQKSAQNSKPQWQKFGRDKEEVQSVETRPKKSGLFSGFAAREQRHSVVGDYPFQQRPQMRGLQARRSDSMYGYVPRAVSLHDATSLLLGKDKEETTKHTNSMLDRFAPCPGWGAGLGIPEDIAGENDNISFSSHDSQTNRQHSKNVYSTNGLEAVTGCQDFDNHSQHSTNRDIPNKLQNGEGNFYFSQPSLNDKSENFSRQDHEFWTGRASKSRNSSTPGDMDNSFSGKDNSEKDPRKTKNNNNSNYYIVTGDNVNLNSEREKEDNLASRRASFDKRNGNETSNKTDEDQLEDLFSSVGEVLY